MCQGKREFILAIFDVFFLELIDFQLVANIACNNFYSLLRFARWHVCKFFFIAFVIRLCTPFRVIVITLVLMCKIQYILTFASTPWWCANTSYINTFEYSWLQLRWKMLGVRCAAVQDCDDDENTFWICRLEILTLISGRAKISS